MTPRGFHPPRAPALHADRLKTKIPPGCVYPTVVTTLVRQLMIVVEGLFSSIDLMEIPEADAQDKIFVINSLRLVKSPPIF